MIEAVERLLPMIGEDTVVVPGHGAATDRRGLLEFRSMLRGIEDRILVLTEAQREVSEIIESKPTGEFDDLWGRGYVTGAYFTRMALAGMGHDMAKILALCGSTARKTHTVRHDVGTPDATIQIAGASSGLPLRSRVDSWSLPSTPASNPRQSLSHNSI
jgi:hypothetical protein